MHITDIKLNIVKNGGKVYYSDTDSIVTNIKLPDSMVDKTKLGLLKLEANIRGKGIFISGKLYSYIDDKGNIVKKCKGFYSNTITFDDYVQLLDAKDISTTFNKQSTID